MAESFIRTSPKGKKHKPYLVGFHSIPPVPEAKKNTINRKENSADELRAEIKKQKEQILNVRDKLMLTNNFSEQ